MSHFLDGDSVRYPGLSKKYRLLRHGPFAIATTLVLGGVDSRTGPGNAIRVVSTLIAEGKTLDGAEPAGYEIGQWKHRFMCDDESATGAFDEAYFAWVSSDFWDYEPNLVFYTKAEFMTLFEDCCRNFVAAHPDRREEFAAALAANGMSLDPTTERP